MLEQGKSASMDADFPWLEVAILEAVILPDNVGW